MKKNLLLAIILLLLPLFIFAQSKVTAEAEKKLRNNDIQGAIAILTKAIEQNNDLFRSYKMRANLYSMQGNIKGAISDLESAIKLKPREGKIYIDLARFKMITGDFQGTFEVYNLAITNGAEGDQVFSGRGLLKQMTGDFDGALNDFELAANIRPHSAIANVGVADMMEKKGDLEGALLYLQSFVNKIENDWDNQFPNYKFKDISNRPIIETQMKDNQQIFVTGQQIILPLMNSPSGNRFQYQTEEFEQLLNFGMAYERLASFYENKGDSEKTLEYANKGILLNPRDTKSFQIRGKIYLRKGNYDGAIEDFNRVINSSPPFAKIFLERGIAYFLKGKETEAQKDFDKYLQMYPKGKEMLNDRLDEAKRLKENSK